MLRARGFGRGCGGESRLSALFNDPVFSSHYSLHPGHGHAFGVDMAIGGPGHGILVIC